MRELAIEQGKGLRTMRRLRIDLTLSIASSDNELDLRIDVTDTHRTGENDDG